MLKISEHALGRIQDYLKQNSASGLAYFRISIDKKDCQGEAFSFFLDYKRQGDQVIEQEGVTLLLDPLVVQYVHGRTLDFIEESKQQGFAIL